VDDVQRSRLGLEQEAMSVVEPEPPAKPLVLPRLREVNEFTLATGSGAAEKPAASALPLT
jgi:hypothetical protein